MNRDLTVDVGVVMSASGLGAYGFHEASVALAKRIESDADWGLALDQRGRIEHQYREKMRAGTYGLEWLKRLYSRDKIVFVPWKKIDRGTTTALREAHFDPEDYKYVETAAQTRCKVLISHDPDYSDAVRQALRRIEVVVRTAAHEMNIRPE